MKQTIYLIYLLLFCSVLLNAQVGISTSTPNAPLEIKSIHSEENISAYQKKSTGKIQDFYKYLTLISDSITSDSVKIVAKENIKQLFNQKDATIIDYSDTNLNYISLDDFLQKLSIQKKQLHFEVQNIQLAPILHNFWNCIYDLSVFDEEQKKLLKLTQNVSLQLVEKQFGDTTKEVWQLQLGGVQLQNE